MQKIATRILSILLLSSVLCRAELDKSQFVKNPKIVMFNVQGTLIDVNILNIETIKHFGFWNSARALFQGDLDTFFNDTLSKVAPTNQDEKSAEKISQIQKDYLLGKISSEECVKTAITWADENKAKFANDYQRELFKRIVHFYFEPANFYKFQKSTSTMKLMKKLFEVKTATDEKRKNIIVLIANQSPEQIKELEKSFPDIFKYSDIQIFSCNEGMLDTNSALIVKALSMCPEQSYYASFMVEKAKSRDKSLNIISGHKINFLSPKNADAQLNAYGALSTEDGI